jgi:hypothetical protein
MRAADGGRQIAHSGDGKLIDRLISFVAAETEASGNEERPPTDGGLFDCRSMISPAATIGEAGGLKPSARRLKSHSSGKSCDVRLAFEPELELEEGVK